MCQVELKLDPTVQTTQADQMNRVGRMRRTVLDRVGQPLRLVVLLGWMQACSAKGLAGLDGKALMDLRLETRKSKALNRDILTWLVGMEEIVDLGAFLHAT